MSKEHSYVYEYYVKNVYSNLQTSFPKFNNTLDSFYASNIRNDFNNLENSMNLPGELTALHEIIFDVGNNLLI